VKRDMGRLGQWRKCMTMGNTWGVGTLEETHLSSPPSPRHVVIDLCPVLNVLHEERKVQFEGKHSQAGGESWILQHCQNEFLWLTQALVTPSPSPPIHLLHLCLGGHELCQRFEVVSSEV